MNQTTECGQRPNEWTTTGRAGSRGPCRLAAGHGGAHRGGDGEEWTTASVRLLPWSSPGGKPAYLVTDPAGASPMARLADSVEADQLRSAREVLRLSGMPETEGATAGELLWILKRVREALADVLRVAESRGMRLPVPEPGE